MKADEWVLLPFPAANRDPAFFERAERVRDRPRREPSRRVRARHPPLHRLQPRPARGAGRGREFVKRFPRFELAGEVTWSQGQIRGPRVLPRPRAGRRMTEPAVPEPAAVRWAEQLERLGHPATRSSTRRPSRRGVTTRGGSRSTTRSTATRRRPAGHATCCRSTGGTVLDVGCGGGRSSLSLVPPAERADRRRPERRDARRVRGRGAAVGVARRTLHGGWPEIAVVGARRRRGGVPSRAVRRGVTWCRSCSRSPSTPGWRWSSRCPTRHPMSAWSPAWRHFWQLERPTARPTAT